MKVAIVIVLLLFWAMASQAQTQFQMACDQGYCVMRESDVDRLQATINAIVKRMEELIEENRSLKERTGCS